MTDPPAVYALSPGGARDYWTLLHPPYTLWHLSFVVLGACIVDTIDVGYLLLAIAAFFLAVGGFLVPAYNLEWFSGRFHSDLWFAVMWGGFPALAGGFAQTGRTSVPLVLIAAGCGAVAAAQRRLSTPVRQLRRTATTVSGVVTFEGGASHPVDIAMMTAAPEGALRVLWLAMVLLAAGEVLARWP